MTLGSLQARLKVANKNLRFRQRTPFITPIGVMTLVGVYCRLNYLGIALDGNDVWVSSKPTHYKKMKNLLTGEEKSEVHSTRRRGRESLVRLLYAKGHIGRAGKQLLSL